jgi:hypothetical protein
MPRWQVLPHGRSLLQCRLVTCELSYRCLTVKTIY